MDCASSSCLAFWRSGSFANQGQPSRFAWAGGGSLAIASSPAFLTSPALQVAAALRGRSPRLVFCHVCRMSSGSGPQRKTDVLRYFGLGKNAAGLAIVELKWLVCVINRVRSSASATRSGSPEGNVAMVHDCCDAINDSFRNPIPFKSRNGMTLIRSIQPRISQAGAGTHTD